MGEKVMNMHKAKRYMQVTCLTCVFGCEQLHQTNVSSISPSLVNREVRREYSLRGALLLHSVDKNQHTNDAGTHAKRHKAAVVHTQEEEEEEEDTNIYTCNTRTQKLVRPPFRLI